MSGLRNRVRVRQNRLIFALFISKSSGVSPAKPLFRQLIRKDREYICLHTLRASSRAAALSLPFNASNSLYASPIVSPAVLSVRPSVNRLMNAWRSPSSYSMRRNTACNALICCGVAGFSFVSFMSVWF